MGKQLSPFQSPNSGGARQYLYRFYPNCGDYPGVVVLELPEPLAAIPIDAACLRSGWRLMLDSLFPECAMYQRLLNPT